MASMMTMLAFAAASGAPPALVDPCIGQDGEIVICGSRRRSDRYRLPPPSPQYERGNVVPRAEGELIPGVRTSAHLDRGDLPAGNRTNRMMVTFSAPF